MRHWAAYRRRITTLAFPADRVRVVIVEGDSVDATAARAAEWAAEDSRVRVVTCSTGKPHYPSIVHPDRFAGLAQVFNAGLDAVDLDWSTHVLILPCDIAYQPDMLTRLLANDVDMVSPLTFMDGRHYDIWAAWYNGNPLGPFHITDTERLLGTELVEMTLIGGTLLMRADVVRNGCRYTPEEVDHGLCKTAKAQGFRLWCDPETKVYHDR